MRIVRFTVDVSAIRQLRHRTPLDPAHLPPPSQQPPAADPSPTGGGPTVRTNVPRDLVERRWSR
jgi:hypothetical protein